MIKKIALGLGIPVMIWGASQLYSGIKNHDNSFLDTSFAKELQMTSDSIYSLERSSPTRLEHPRLLSEQYSNLARLLESNPVESELYFKASDDLNKSNNNLIFGSVFLLIGGTLGSMGLYRGKQMDKELGIAPEEGPATTE